jgi:anti-anti-sigma regulatory factor
MLDVSVERIGHLGIVGCRGSIVNFESASELRAAGMSLSDSRVIVLDLSEVIAFEGGGLGVLVFLDRWALKQNIEFRVFNPRKAVRDRLELIRLIQPVKAVSLKELMTLLADGSMTDANTEIAFAA